MDVFVNAGFWIIAWLPLVLSYPDIAGDCNGPGGPHIPSNALSKNITYKVSFQILRALKLFQVFPRSL